MSNTPLDPLSRGDLKVSLGDICFKWIPDQVRDDKWTLWVGVGVRSLALAVNLVV